MLSAKKHAGSAKTSRETKHSAALATEIHVALKVLEGLDTPLSLSVAILLRNEEYDQIVQKEIEPMDYDSWYRFSDDYLATSLLKKSKVLPCSFDKEALAIAKFEQSESDCALTNSFFDAFMDGKVSLTPWFASLVHHVREQITHVLGPLTRRTLERCEEAMAFGPGATRSVSGLVTYGLKFGNSSPTVTPDLLSYGIFAIPPGWRKHIEGFTVVNGSKVTTVPKNSKIDRVICIEPDLNIFVQKGIGAVIRQKLLNTGLDLSTQGNNQRLAREGSIGDHLVTLDLSSASDTISRGIVEALVPVEWLELLRMARSAVGTYGEKEYSFEKWSSMGNGYTFELETLIFISVLRAIAEMRGLPKQMRSDIIAYGDDLIYPNEIDDDVRRALNFFGFKVNTEKTFGSGPFRESCGADYFEGHQVRPFFLRSNYDQNIETRYTYANGLRRWAHQRLSSPTSGECDARLLPAWLRLFGDVASRDRHRVPIQVGDVGFHGALDEALNGSVQVRHGILHVKCRIPRSESRVTHMEGALTSFLSGNVTDFSLGRESLRGRICGSITKYIPVLNWDGYGPWI